MPNFGALKITKNEKSKDFLSNDMIVYTLNSKRLENLDLACLQIWFSRQIAKM